MGKTNLGPAQALIIGAALALAQLGPAQAGGDLVYDEPPVMALPPEPCCSPWYLKGFLGMTSYEVDDIYSDVFETSHFEVLNAAFEASSFGGLGIGYEWSNWLRFDVTSEYRNRATFHGLDRYHGWSYGKKFSGTNEYTATLKSWTSLANAYWDMFCWKGITPFVGAGIGYAKNWVGDYQDINVPNKGVAFGKTTDEGGLAWALHAGLAYDVTPNFTVELAYRYLNLGDADAGKAYAYDKSSVVDALEFDNVYSNDIMLGVRWKFGCCGGGPAPMPVALK
jgi:opacity protein-like surface antigen